MKTTGRKIFLLISDHLLPTPPLITDGAVVKAADGHVFILNQPIFDALHIG